MKCRKIKKKQTYNYTVSGGFVYISKYNLPSIKITVEEFEKNYRKIPE